MTTYTYTHRYPGDCGKACNKKGASNLCPDHQGSTQRSWCSIRCGMTTQLGSSVSASDDKKGTFNAGKQIPATNRVC